MIGAKRTPELTRAHWIADTSEPVLETSIGDALRRAATAFGARTALVDGIEGGGRRWTYDGLLADAERTARALSARFAPGEHVAIFAANSPEWVMAEFGAALAGLTLVTVNPAFLAKEVAYVLGQSRAAGVIVQNLYRSRDLVAVVEEARAELPGLREVIALDGWDAFLAGGDTPHALPAVAPTDIAQIQYTSGTTGFPKGAQLTHRGLANNGRFFARSLHARPEDVWVNPMPMFHTAGCGLVTLGALQTGGVHVLPPAFDPALMLALFEAERGTLMLSVPTMLIRMLDHPDAQTRDLSAWRLSSLGGAPVPPELVRRARDRFGVKVAIGFGQTEASPYLTHTVPDDPHPNWIETVGPPLPQTELKVVDPASGETLGLGQTGEICARAPGVMAGYFDNPGATAQALDAEGWLHTGDLGSMDSHGYCRIEGRLKDMIIRGGENIYPREIEDVLFTHPSVASAAVLGVPDTEWGEQVAAFVQARPGATLDEAALAAFCRAHLAPFKVPRLWRIVDQFPQTASGKIQKFVLRDQFRAQNQENI
ncbi:AMP-binding protein [Aquabacter cavernae]|uniref:AMP-binding protein n=1 Tax=Aquabacter cavernae TaxID=2496029 RepID=UPI000F8DB5B4|nr:AMP-binding protein [Aquabacter cavernae]